MDNNLNEVETESSSVTIRDLLLILKRHVVLMLAIVLIFTAVGVVYAKVKKPNFTVVNKLIYSCENLEYTNSEGEKVSSATTSDINTMLAYGETIIDMFNKGVVLDRANYYYGHYLNEKMKGAKLEDVLSGLDNADGYTPPAENARPKEHINKGSIGVQSISEDKDETVFAFKVSYTSPNVNDAREKLAILIYAFSKECKELDSEGGVKYFGEFNVNISDREEDGVMSDVSKVKITVVFFLIGIVAALLTVCAVTLLDNTIKSKEQLEKITGVPMFAAIDNVG